MENKIKSYRKYAQFGYFLIYYHKLPDELIQSCCFLKVLFIYYIASDIYHKLKLEIPLGRLKLKGMFKNI